jgi:hypothetical protein
MPAQPANPQPTEDSRISRKRQAPLNANGEPVTIPVPKKKKSASEQTGKKKAAPTKPGLQKKSAVPEKLAPAKRKPSVEIEEVPDEDNLTHSEVPRNPRNILEAANGSDDDVDYPPPAPMDVDSPSQTDEEEDTVEIIEKPEEDDEAELGLHLFSIWNSSFLI